MIPNITDTTKNEFSIAVEMKAAAERKPYLTALAEVVEECQIDESRVGKLINKSLKDKIEAEALLDRTIRGVKGQDVFEPV